MTRILIVEDTRDIAEGIRDNLVQEGYEVRIETDGAAGLAAARSWTPDLIVLDLLLPRMDGYAVLRSLRSEGATMPVLILSARSTEIEKVRGFRVGADDYVTKPFGLLELMARVDALCRRASQPSLPSAPATLTFGPLTIRPAARVVERDGVALALRPREVDLLLALVRRPRTVWSRRQLLEEVWSYDPKVESRTVDWHVAELRRKIERDPAHPEYIATVRKVGYRWDQLPDAARV
jgi:DNA-binding response OmpR family regulator